MTNPSPSVPADAPQLSVLIPTWNSETTIERALASVLETADRSLEVVVVDDGSTDGTADVVGRARDADPRVRLERLPVNGGASAARNQGLALVRGEWLTLLDADDRFTAGGLGRLAAAAVDAGALAAVGQQVWTDGRRRWISDFYDRPDIRAAGRKSLASAPGLLYFVSPHAKLFHRSCWDGLQFEGGALGDQAWVVRAMLRAGDRIDVIEDTVYEWHRPPRGDTRSSITSRTRASARGGVATVATARAALDAVSEEAAARLDEAAAGRVLATYVERLLRSDLGVQVRQAVGRGDPTVGELLDAVAGFVEGTPRALLQGSDALAADVLAPPLAGWHRMNPAGRAAYARLVAAARRADPGVVGRARDLRVRLALRLGLGLPPGVGRPAAEVVLLASLAGVAGRVLRRLRPAPA